MIIIYVSILSISIPAISGQAIPCSNDGHCMSHVTRIRGNGFCCGGYCESPHAQNPHNVKAEGDACECDQQCWDNLICCNGICSSDDNRGENEECSCHEQCNGYPGTSACCNGVCKTLQTNFDGGLYCPWACQQGPECPQGSCIDTIKSIGESCVCNSQCGFPSSGIGCCNGVCQQTQVNYDGGLYCPYACKAGVNCPAGSCPANTGDLCDTCSCDEQCSTDMDCFDGNCMYQALWQEHGNVCGP